MSDDKNTEKLTKGEGRAVRGLAVAGKVLAVVVDVALFVVFVFNLYLILTHDFDLGTVSFGAMAFFYLLADAVDQGIRRAMDGFKIGVRVGDDTPDAS